MTSNDDPTGEKKAFKQILACTAFNTLVPFGMALQGSLHPIFIVPFCLAQVKAFQATFHFRREQGDKKSAKNLKRQSYPPFLVLLVGFGASTCFSKYRARRQNDQAEWKL